MEKANRNIMNENDFHKNANIKKIFFNSIDIF